MTTTPHTRKKVLYLITKSNWGGAQRYVYDLANTLDKIRFDPVVAMGGEGVLSEMLQNAGIRTIILDEMKNKLSLKQARKAARELRQVLIIERPDVLHVNSSTAGLVGALVGHTTRVPNIIFTAHGWAFNEDRPLIERLILKTLHYITVLLADRTIAVSRAIVTQMNWPFAERKMKVINPGRTIGVTYERNEAREKLIGFCPELAPFQNDTWLVTIAELHPIKRHLVLLDAFRQLKVGDQSLRLILIGEGSERARIETYIATHHLANRVILTGNITEAARFLKAFDLFVLASKSESYGYVLHEAGLTGVPIIATNVGGIPDIIENHTSGLLVPPDNAPALETAMHSLLVNPMQKADYANALHTELSGRSVVKMTRQTEGLY